MASRSPAPVASLFWMFVACASAPPSQLPSSETSGAAGTAAPATSSEEEISETAEAPIEDTSAAGDTGANAEDAAPEAALGDPLDGGAPDDGGADGGKGKKGRGKVPVAKVTIGAFTVARGRVFGAARVIGSMTADFRNCMNKALRADPESIKDGATLELRVRLDESGHVAGMPSTTSLDLPQAAVDCVTARVNQAEFSPPSSGYARITIPITVNVAP